MNAFIGSWKRVRTENYSEYLRALGIGDEQISVAQVIKPILTFYQDGDYIVIKTETSIQSGEVWFRLGEEFFETSKDGRECENIVTLEGSKLVHVQKWDKNQTKFVREVNGKTMVMTLTFGNIVSTHTYEKV